LTVFYHWPVCILLPYDWGVGEDGFVPLSHHAKLGATIKQIAPAQLHDRLRKIHQRFVFSRALNTFVKSPTAAIRPGSTVLSDLVYGWGNPWSAKEEYLVACLNAAMLCKGQILECGSGLSTLLLGIIAKQKGFRVIALEHNEAWAAKVNAQLKRVGVNSVLIDLAPLRDYGEFTWYSPTMAPRLEAASFELVICDGPPGSTRGGRYGLVPVMRDRLRAGTTILLDDGARPQEQDVARHWAQILPASHHLEGTEKPYIRLTLNA
jgi:predicted O-methyltransferase YrrM